MNILNSQHQIKRQSQIILNKYSNFEVKRSARHDFNFFHNSSRDRIQGPKYFNNKPVQMQISDESIPFEDWDSQKLNAPRNTYELYRHEKNHYMNKNSSSFINLPLGNLKINDIVNQQASLPDQGKQYQSMAHKRNQSEIKLFKSQSRQKNSFHEVDDLMANKFEIPKHF